MSAAAALTRCGRGSFYDSEETPCTLLDDSDSPVPAEPPEPAQRAGRSRRAQPSDGGPDLSLTTGCTSQQDVVRVTCEFWVLVMGGWILSSVFGLVLGYLLVLWLFPEIDGPHPGRGPNIGDKPKTRLPQSY